jgi:5S rRNA maturation endonuclease (ribonuclease M5)/archaellum biogenesis ATPase FlaH
MSSVPSGSRYTRQRPCPICGGNPMMERGKQQRCIGYLSNDGEIAFCSREEQAGSLTKNPNTECYAHRLKKQCGCGTQHGFSFSKGMPMPTTTRTAPPNKLTASKSYPSKIVATYNYQDREGTVLYRVLRYEPKTFKQQKPGKDGLWEWGVDGVEQVPYNLPEILAYPPDRYIFVVEGEKDVETLRSIGVVATCNAMGAGKWQATFRQYFIHRKVVVIADNDDKGREHAAKVVENLKTCVKELKVITPIGVPEKGDITDYVNMAIAEGKDPRTAIGALAAKATNVPLEPYANKLLNITALNSIQKPKWLVKGELYAGTLALYYGAAGTKKTFYLLDLALKLASSGKKVIYVAAEGLAGIPKRIEGWLKAHESSNPHPNFYVYPEALPVHETDKLAEFLFTLEYELFSLATDLIVLDTLNQNSVGLDENQQKDITCFFAAQKRLRNATGATILTVHHSGWGEVDRLRGSSSMSGVVDTIVKFEMEGDLTKVSCERQKDGIKFAQKYLKWVTMDVGGDEESERTTLVPIPSDGEKVLDENGSPTARLILEQLRWSDENNYLSVEEICVGSYHRAGTLRRSLREMLDRGLIAVNSKNKFRITPQGQDVLAPQELQMGNNPTQDFDPPF